MKVSLDFNPHLEEIYQLAIDQEKDIALDSNDQKPAFSLESGNAKFIFSYLDGSKNGEVYSLDRFNGIVLVK